MLETRNRHRKIHLDFHNSPLIPSIGDAFDADAFASTLADAQVNYVVCFAKCHHGMCYYNAAAGTRHPGLSFDLLAAQIESCHQHNIAVSAYLSVVWEEEAARLHPDWQQLGPDGSPRHQVPGDRWATVCLNSPYIRDMLIPQVEEVTRNYEVDGLWFDMIHLDDNACYCRWCRDRMARRGLSYDNPEHGFRHTAESVYGFLNLCSSAIRNIKPSVDIEYNSQVRFGARPAIPHITGFEIECTPSERSYLYFPMFARHIRTLKVPFRGVTPRFHRVWADFGSLKNEAQLRWETATMLTNGGSCSIGDQMHPNGRLDAAVYNRIGSAYRRVQEVESWCCGTDPVTEIAVLVDPDITDFGIAKASPAVWGATRMLVETHHQFNLLDKDTDFTPYRLLILPENTRITSALASRIETFLQTGGSVIMAGCATLDPTSSIFLLPSTGLRYVGRSPYTANYLELLPDFRGDLPDFHYIIRHPVCLVEPTRTGIQILARLGHPYFERTPEHFTSHHHAPQQTTSPHPAIVQNGRLIYLCAPCFSAYHLDGDTHLRHIVEACLARLLPSPLIRTTPNPMLEIGLMSQPARDRRIIHLTYYAANKRGACPETIEYIPPLHDVKLAVRSDHSLRCTLVPEGVEIPSHHAHGYVHMTLPRIDIHQMVALETLQPAGRQP